MLEVWVRPGWAQAFSFALSFGNVFLGFLRLFYVFTGGFGNWAWNKSLAIILFSLRFIPSAGCLTFLFSPDLRLNAGAKESDIFIVPAWAGFHSTGVFLGFSQHCNVYIFT
jgi:hypothetical protein